MTTTDVMPGADESRALREARALARLSIAAARASTAEAVARILLDELTAAMPGASAGVAVLDEDGRAFELIGVRRTGEHATTFRDRWSFDLASAAHDVVVTGVPVSLTRDEYLTRYPQVSSIADPQTLARYVAIPIIPGIRPIGAAGVSWAEEPGLDDAAMAHLQALVDAGAQALGRARLEDAERRTRYPAAGDRGPDPAGHPDHGARRLAAVHEPGVQPDLPAPGGDPQDEAGMTEVLDEAGVPIPLEQSGR